MSESQDHSNVAQSSQNVQIQIGNDQDSPSLNLLQPLEETLFHPALQPQEPKGREQTPPKDEEANKSGPKPLEDFGLTVSGDLWRSEYSGDLKYAHLKS